MYSLQFLEKTEGNDKGLSAFIGKCKLREWYFDEAHLFNIFMLWESHYEILL